MKAYDRVEVSSCTLAPCTYCIGQVGSRIDLDKLVKKELNPGQPAHTQSLYGLIYLALIVYVVMHFLSLTFIKQLILSSGKIKYLQSI